MTEELKPCPFCGSTSLDPRGYRDERWIECRNCEAISPTTDSEEAAAHAWNRVADWQSTARAANWLPPEEVAKLREALRDLLNDTQHSNHANCDDGPCPVREAREVLAAIDAARTKGGEAP